jgi:hypothetical protein
MRHTLVLNGHFAAGDRFSIVVVPLHAGRYICGLVADSGLPSWFFVWIHECIMERLIFWVSWDSNFRTIK